MRLLRLIPRIMSFPFFTFTKRHSFPYVRQRRRVVPAAVPPHSFTGGCAVSPDGGGVSSFHLAATAVPLTCAPTSRGCDPALVRLDLHARGFPPAMRPASLGGSGKGATPSCGWRP
ncbi:hypothetical protein BDA96_09G163600 [Sorghum bicolor]|uniref:Uncharacterized protein n=2 Tax=Sorghum bicolor TaxID=4558 RepID=A0A1B6P9B6_SORBI|nr:hypothetical protein BDA96_09G163600 [Sorghum bicolor]KXG22115.1 hypothetical protein SORBI_3009G156100 [Sorghum bicolor]OQU78110.1 hypothetical protein SORBI_3009G156100 [Sorghum bicolor]OQU78111.1 hypothetical protein SORBI_3009G156100 [Sorghum bicolor]